MTNHQTALVLFAISVAVAIIAAMITTAENVNMRVASNEPAARKVGQPPLHPLLNRAPEQEPGRLASGRR